MTNLKGTITLFYNTFITVLKCYEQRRAIMRRSNCTKIASVIGILCKWPSGMQVERELSTYIPDGHLQRVTRLDAVLIQLTS